MSRAGIRHLKSLTLFYCQHGGSSRTVRDFVERDLPKLADELPSVLVAAEKRNGKHPYVKGEYLNGYVKTVTVKNLDNAGLSKTLSMVIDSAGHGPYKVGERVFTQHPSIQGVSRMQIGAIPPL